MKVAIYARDTRCLTFQLAQAQLEVIERALAIAQAEDPDRDPNNPNPRGNALFRVCQAYLNARRN